MQAMHIHLGPSQAIGFESSRGVQGMNNSVENDSSFDAMLQQKINEDKIPAKEGPPEESKVQSSQTETEKPVEQKVSENVREDAADSEQPVETQKDSIAEYSDEEKMAMLEKNLAVDLDSSVIDGKVIKAEMVLDANNELKGATEEPKLSSDEELQVGFESEIEKAAIPTESADLIASTKNSEFLVDENLKEEKLEDEATLDDVSAEQFALVSENVEVAKTTQTTPMEEIAIDGQEIAQIDETDVKETKKVLAEAPQIAVIDERTVTQEAQQDGKFVKSVNYDGNGNATIDLSLNQNGLQTAPGTIVNSDGSVQQHTVSNAQQFGTMLSSELQSNSAELVKTGSIILKDGNSGTINLILHPEELGNVKLKLEISDNVLTGKITVASEETFNAFKSNITSLREAFEAKGFETGGFDLSWSGSDDAHEQGQQKEDRRNPFANRYDDMAVIADVQDLSHGVYGQQSYIDLIA